MIAAPSTFGDLIGPHRGVAHHRKDAPHARQEPGAGSQRLIDTALAVRVEKVVGHPGHVGVKALFVRRHPGVVRRGEHVKLLIPGLTAVREARVVAYFPQELARDVALLDRELRGGAQEAALLVLQAATASTAASTSDLHDAHAS